MKAKKNILDYVQAYEEDYEDEKIDEVEFARETEQNLEQSDSEIGKNDEFKLYASDLNSINELIPQIKKYKSLKRLTISH
jgi:hypothetical protein